jgi:hypothetical protein
MAGTATDIERMQLDSMLVALENKATPWLGVLAVLFFRPT